MAQLLWHLWCLLVPFHPEPSPECEGMFSQNHWKSLALPVREGAALLASPSGSSGLQKPPPEHQEVPHTHPHAHSGEGEEQLQAP